MGRITSGVITGMGVTQFIKVAHIAKKTLLSIVNSKWSTTALKSIRNWFGKVDSPATALVTYTAKNQSTN